jgi:hypothetical protein
MAVAILEHPLAIGLRKEPNIYVPAETNMFMSNTQLTGEPIDVLLCVSPMPPGKSRD